MNVRTPESPDDPLGPNLSIGSRLLYEYDDGYRPQASGMPVSHFAGKQWSSILHGTGWAKHSHRDSALSDEAGFPLPSDEGEVWHSKQKMYNQPAPVYSPNVIDEELQRILKALGLSNTTPAKDVPTVTETMPAGTPPDTDPISRAIAEYYRDQAA